jgi:heptosyltransferase II
VSNTKTDKILIVKLGAIGDVVMTLPLISDINKTRPNSQITWICGETVYDLLCSVPGIKSLIKVNESALLKGGILKVLLTLFKIYSRIGFRYFDHIYILYRDNRYKIITALTFRHKLSSLMGSDRNSKFIPGRYYGNEFIRLWRETDDFSIMDAVYPRLTYQLSENFLKYLSTNSKRIIIQPGGAKNILQDNDLRRWALSRYVSLTDKLLKNDYSVIITGIESDGWVVGSFEKLNIINLIGKTSLMDLVAIISNVNAVVCHDTGILHLTKLTPTPAVGLFGPVDPRERISRNSNIYPLWGGKKLNCSPCYDGKYFAPCGNNVCMQNIEVDEVYQLILKLTSGK